MKPLLLLTAMLTFITLQARSQHTADELAFEYAISLYEDDRVDDALLALYEFMSVHPKSRLRGSAHFNIGYIQYQRQHLEAAIATFKQIVDADYNELDDNNLMEPYKLYKHQSCRLLAEISLEQRDYRAAEEYIRLFEDVYPYQHFCGNELSAFAIYTATMKARAFEGQGKVDKAIQTLVPFTFSDGLASNQDLLVLLIDILYRSKSNEEIKQELNVALASVDLKKKNRGATMTLFGKQINMNEHFFDETDVRNDLSHYLEKAKQNLLFARFL